MKKFYITYFEKENEKANKEDDLIYRLTLDIKDQIREDSQIKIKNKRFTKSEIMEEIRCFEKLFDVTLNDKNCYFSIKNLKIDEDDNLIRSIDYKIKSTERTREDIHCDKDDDGFDYSYENISIVDFYGFFQ